MARGLQKIEAQQKKAAAAKKGGTSTLKSDKGLKYTCNECRIGCDNMNNMKAHWEAKHPKLAVPTDNFASMIKPTPAK